MTPPGSTIPGSTILVVEDDPDIRQLVTDLLGREGFTVQSASDGRALDAALARAIPDLVILDLMLPGEDGLSICRRLRARHNLPILMLSAKSEEVDRVIGLEMGADDYLVKPFGPRELVARVRAMLRRGQSGGQSGDHPRPERRFAFDIFIVDVDARQIATRTGEAVMLTSGEFDLLACLIRAPRRVLSRDQILDWTRGRQAGPFDRTVDMLMSRLRRKLEAASPGSNLIATVRNGGYLLTSSVQQQI